MVFLNDGVKDGGKVLVGVPVTSIDSTVLVVKVNSTGNGLDKSESRSLGLDSLQLLPFVLGHMLGNKRMLGLDVREGSIGLGRHSLVHRNSSSLLQNFVLFPELVDSINHLLDKLHLRVSKSVLVGDVISVSSLATRLSTGSTGLQVKLFTSCLELVNSMLGPSRKVNMDRGPHTSTKVGGARVDVTILGIQAEVPA